MTLIEALKNIEQARHEAELGRVNLDRVVFAARQLLTAAAPLTMLVPSELRRAAENLEEAIRPHEGAKVNPFDSCGCDKPWHECVD